MKLSTKRVVATVTALLALLSFSRVIVLFLEALSVVRDERAHDTELLEACQLGVARSSLKMRSVCLQAQAERASPIVFKAVLRAFATAYSDFTVSVSTPGKLAIVVLFLLSSVFLPVSQWIRAFVPEQDSNSNQIVVLAQDGAPKSRIRSRIAGALRMRKQPSKTAFYDDDCDVPEFTLTVSDEESTGDRLKCE